jgi:hypothetical protein
MYKRVVSLLLAAVMLLALSACKTEEEPTVTTFADVPGVALVPEEFWDETQPPAETEAPAAPAETETDVPEETKSPDATEDVPSESQQPTEKPTDPVVQMTQYEWYHSLSGEQQMAYMETFDSLAAFFDWYNAAKEEHEKLKPGIEIGSGDIDFGDIFGGNG